MKESSKQAPYKSLGEQLRKIREKKQESLAEVSGAVEIDVMLLTDIEYGVKRPSEDILMLLMNHFSIPDDKAIELWEKAGYDRPETNQDAGGSLQVKQVMVMPMDARIAYTDMAHIMVNGRGVVMNFMQEAGLGGQPLAVARIGMSREHAQEVMNLLQKALGSQQQKILPAPESRDSGSDQKKQS